MTLYGIIGTGILTAVLCAVLREFNKGYAVAAACAGGLAVFAWGAAALAPVLQYLRELAAFEAVSPYLNTAMKALGIGFITQIGADICRDTGESALAAKVEFAGKAAILAVCLPSLKAVLDMSVGIVGG